MNSSYHQRNTIQLLRRYIRDRRTAIITAVIMAAVFAAVTALYALPLAAAAYTCVISIFVVFVVGVVDFARYRSRHASLNALRDSVCLSLDGMPEPSGLMEEDYQQLIIQLFERQREKDAESRRLQLDMTDYYTLWVHQIKIPLSALDLLIQSDNHDKQALQGELFFIEQYVDMALSYIRLESRSSDYVLCRCDLDAIVRRAVRKYARLFILRDVALDFEQISLEVLTDEKWLSFVIEQLLSNAVKYAPHGKVTISVQDGQLLISDTGIGIDASDIPRIFEKGFTGYNGRHGEHSSGLGLYLSKKALSKLSHSISIDSALGVGTTVTIGFPQGDFVRE